MSAGQAVSGCHDRLRDPVPIIVAALRPSMLRLAAQIGDGAFTNFLPLGSAPTVVDAFGSPDKELVCRFFVVPGPEDEALAVARRVFVAYATVPVYSEFFRWLGWSEAIDPVVEAWNAGDRSHELSSLSEMISSARRS